MNTMNIFLIIKDWNVLYFISKGRKIVKGTLKDFDWIQKSFLSFLIHKIIPRPQNCCCLEVQCEYSKGSVIPKRGKDELGSAGFISWMGQVPWFHAMCQGICSFVERKLPCSLSRDSSCTFVPPCQIYNPSFLDEAKSLAILTGVPCCFPQPHASWNGAWETVQDILYMLHVINRVKLLHLAIVASSCSFRKCWFSCYCVLETTLDLPNAKACPPE